MSLSIPCKFQANQSLKCLQIVLFAMMMMMIIIIIMHTAITHPSSILWSKIWDSEFRRELNVINTVSIQFMQEDIHAKRFAWNICVWLHDNYIQLEHWNLNQFWLDLIENISIGGVCVCMYLIILSVVHLIVFTVLLYTAVHCALCRTVLSQLTIIFWLWKLVCSNKLIRTICIVHKKFVPLNFGCCQWRE